MYSLIWFQNQKKWAVDVSRGRIHRFFLFGQSKVPDPGYQLYWGVSFVYTKCIYRIATFTTRSMKCVILPSLPPPTPPTHPLRHAPLAIGDRFCGKIVPFNGLTAMASKNWVRPPPLALETTLIYMRACIGVPPFQEGRWCKLETTMGAHMLRMMPWFHVMCGVIKLWFKSLCPEPHPGKVSLMWFLWARHFPSPVKIRLYATFPPLRFDMGLVQVRLTLAAWNWKIIYRAMQEFMQYLKHLGRGVLSLLKA